MTVNANRKGLTSFFGRSIAISAILATTSQAHAGLITHYTFDRSVGLSDISGSATTYDLSAVGGAADLTRQAYFSDGLSTNHLKVAGPGGTPDWTLSLWVNTALADQGTFKALFSNQYNSSNDFSWQVDSNDGFYRLLAKDNTVSGNAQNSLVIGQATANVWENIVVQKSGGSSATVFFNGAQTATGSFNPGGLQNFRLGINRNSSQSFEGYLDNVQIWDDNRRRASEIFEAGVGTQTVPAPATLALIGLGLAGLGWTRRKA